MISDRSNRIDHPNVVDNSPAFRSRGGGGQHRLFTKSRKGKGARKKGREKGRGGRDSGKSQVTKKTFVRRARCLLLGRHGQLSSSELSFPTMGKLHGSQALIVPSRAAAMCCLRERGGTADGILFADVAKLLSLTGSVRVPQHDDELV